MAMARIKTGIPSEDDLLHISAQVMSGWELLAKVLGFHDVELDHLTTDNTDLFEQCYQMLLRWKQKFGSQGNYKALVKALQHPLVNREHLALQYCYQT